MKALEPIDVIPSKNNGPYAIKTRLGWYIVGPVDGTRSRQGIHCNRIAVKPADTKDVGKHYFQNKTSVAENDVQNMLTRLYNLNSWKLVPLKLEIGNWKLACLERLKNS